MLCALGGVEPLAFLTTNHGQGPEALSIQSSHRKLPICASSFKLFQDLSSYNLLPFTRRSHSLRHNNQNFVPGYNNALACSKARRTSLQATACYSSSCYWNLCQRRVHAVLILCFLERQYRFCDFSFPNSIAFIEAFEGVDLSLRLETRSQNHLCLIANSLFLLLWFFSISQSCDSAVKHFVILALQWMKFSQVRSTRYFVEVVEQQKTLNEGRDGRHEMVSCASWSES